ncbi:MAG TPA: phosphohydrolase [Microbacterium sp.]|uniref:phosphohydrolase n=1 Tax=Microbacterium sp. TaxID=51671 RepID=UPI000EEFB899|nr:phosphohydrolase [Microbacterium sp.]
MAETEHLLAAWTERSGGESAAWTRVRPGPAVDAVATRLSAIPHSFLDPRVSIAALAQDTLQAPLSCLAYVEDQRVRRGAAIGLWLLSSEEVIGRFSPELMRGTPALAVDALALRLAPVADPLEWLADGERRIEAVRTFLLWSRYLPEGEDHETARSLLTACDSLARNQALADAYEGHRHRAEIARALEEARRKEAAARYSSE